LVYGKLASVAATAQVVTTVDLTGTAYALGVQVMSGKNVYYQAEYLQTKYDEKAKENFNVSTVSFVVGYKF
jgi:opacity protein-like surface antigen